jgi:hypothetical protein
MIDCRREPRSTAFPGAAGGKTHIAGEHHHEQETPTRAKAAKADQ